jgi:signal transduction histidine kinase
VSGPGLQMRMALSYVLVTSVVVVLAGALLLVLVGQRVVSAADGGSRVRTTATQDAATLTAVTRKLARLPKATELQSQLGRLAPGAANPVCDAAVDLGPGAARGSGGGVAIPCVRGVRSNDAPMSLMLLISADGKVVATSYPGRFPVGGKVAALLAVESLDDFGRGATGGLPGTTAEGAVLWALAPVDPRGPASKATGGNSAGARPLASVYVQVPASPGIAGPPISDLLVLGLPWGAKLDGGRLGPLGSVSPLLQLGVALVVVSVPVGVLVGLVTSVRLRRRVRRLASTSTGIAMGDLGQRVTVGGGDEVGEVEEAVNAMADWLSAALTARERLADGAAADVESSRVARELHASVSRSLYSLTVMAGGLRKALPPGSPISTGVAAIEATAGEAMRDMRTLLPRLGPPPEGDGGLIPALQQLCGAFQARFGVAVQAEVQAERLAEPVAHAVLQVAREALTNAAQHSDPRWIALRVAADYQQVEVEVRHDGNGSPGGGGAGATGAREPGLDRLREWVGQLGGSLRVERRDGVGTRLRVLLPIVTA